MNPQTKININSLQELRTFIIENKQYFSRYLSFLKIIDLIESRFKDKPLNIVETGTMRGYNGQWSGGDGCSSLFWAILAKLTSGHFWTVDISNNNIEECKKFTEQFSNYITYTVQDSIQFLRDFDKKIDILYLDSYDTGSDSQMVAACRHQLLECEVVLDKLNNNSIILSDDAPRLDIGKVAYSVPFLINNGYHVLYNSEELGQVALSKIKNV